MTTNTGTFQPLGHSDRRLHGPTALLLCGYDPAEHRRLRQALAEAGLAEVPLRGIAAAEADRTVAELAAHAQAGNPGDAPVQPRAVIVSGVTEAQLQRVMAAYRGAGLGAALWASVTPVNAAWTLRALLSELSREREALRAAMRAEARPK